MKQSLRCMLTILIVSHACLNAYLDNNYFNPPANAVIKGPANARGVDNVDCCNTQEDQAELTLSKVCIIDSDIDVVSDLVLSEESKLCDILSALDTQTAITDLTQEFGGTYTALEEVISKLCVVEDGVDLATETTTDIESKACVVESKVDNLDVSGSVDEEFGGTFTMIEAVTSKVCVVEDTVDQTSLVSSEITSKICVIESKFDALDVSETVNQEFQGTYTLIATNESKACVIDQDVTTLDETSDAVLSKVCVVESKIHAIDATDNLVDEFASLQESLQEVTSKLCAVEDDVDHAIDTSSLVFSKACAFEDTVDYFDISQDLSDEFGGTYTLIDSIISKVCVVETEVTDVDIVNDELLSKLCAIESHLDNQFATVDLSQEFGGTYTALEDVISKVCVVEEKVNAENEQADGMLSKICAFESELDALDVSVDLSDEFGGTYTALDEMLSKVCVIDGSVSTLLTELDAIRTQDFGGTFTVIEAIFNKVCDIDVKLDNLSLSELDSLMEVTSILEEIVNETCTTVTTISDLTESIVETLTGLDAVLTSLNEELCSTFDKVCDVENSTDALGNELDMLHVQDFGGTFTLIEAITDKLCTSESFIDNSTDISDGVFSKACIIESVVDQIITEDIDLTEEFGGTFTLLAEKTSKLCVIESKVDVVDQLADDMESKVCVVESKFDALDISMNVADEFGGTFTLIETITSKVCVIEDTVDIIDQTDSETNSKLCVMEDALTTLITSQLDLVDEFGGTYTALEESISKICAVEDKTDNLQATHEQTLSKVCIVDSQVDIIDLSTNFSQEFMSLIDLLDLNVSKLCVVESKVDDVAIDSDMLESKLCVIDDAVINLDVSNTIKEEFTGTYTALEEMISKICVVDDTTQTTSGNTVDIMNKLMIIEGLVDTIDVSGNLSDEFAVVYSKLQVIEDKVCAGLCEPIVINSVPYTITAAGTYLLEDDLILTPGPATMITISSNDVVLDLCQKTLIGDADITGIAVTASRRNVTIKNGHLRGSAPLDTSLAGRMNTGITVAGGCSLLTIDDIDMHSVGTAAGYAIRIGNAAGSAIRGVSITNCQLIAGARGIYFDAVTLGSVIEDIEIYNVQIDNFVGTKLAFVGSTAATSINNGIVSNCQFTTIELPLLASAVVVLDMTYCSNITFEHLSFTNHDGPLLALVQAELCQKCIFDDIEISCNASSEDLNCFELNNCSSCVMHDVRVAHNSSDFALNGFICHGTLNSAHVFDICRAYNNSADTDCVGFLFRSTDAISTENIQCTECQALENSSISASAYGFALLYMGEGMPTTVHSCNMFIDCIANSQSGDASSAGFSISRVIDHHFIRCVASCNSGYGFVTTPATTVLDTEFKDCQAMNNSVAGFDLTGTDSTITMIRNIACFNGL